MLLRAETGEGAAAGGTRHVEGNLLAEGRPFEVHIAETRNRDEHSPSGEEGAGEETRRADRRDRESPISGR